MSWIGSSGLISGGLIATGSAALFLAVWMSMRLRMYRSAGQRNTIEGGRGETTFLLWRRDFLAGLVEDADFDFLAAQPGYRRDIGKNLRRARKRIFRMYLCELAQEFHRSHAEAREMVADSSERYAPVVGQLMRQELTFWQSLVRIELSLAVPQFTARRSNKLRRHALDGLFENMQAMRLSLAPVSGQRS